MQWCWRNDPEGLPDDDLARCIAAPGERLLVCGMQVFKMTTHPSSCIPQSAGAPGSTSCSILRIEYAGFGWVRDHIVHSWSSAPFDHGPLGNGAQYAAGIALMATVATELASA